MGSRRLPGAREGLTRSRVRPVTAGLLGLVLLAQGGVAVALPWQVTVAGSNSALAIAQAVPTPPTPTSACVSLLGTTVSVTWSAVSEATSYSVSQSTTSASTGFSVVAPGVVGTSWTSGALAAGTYWFKVASRIGTNWISALSTATSSRTIALLACV